MNIQLTRVSILGVAVGLTSCFQIEQKSVVNPDGSGSFTVQTTVNAGAMAGLLGGLGQPGEAPKPDKAQQAAQGRELLLGMLSKAQGVDAWTEATSNVDAAGVMSAKASGLFKDISKLTVGGTSGGGGGGPKMDGPEFQFQVTKDAAGNMVLELPLEKSLADAKKKQGEQGDAPKDPAAKKAKRAQELQQMEMMMGMMGAMLKDAKMTYTFNFGQGTVTDPGCFKLVNPNTVSVEIKPMNMLTAMTSIMKDDKMADIMDASDTFDPKNPDHQKVLAAMAQAMFGKAGKPRVVVKTAGPAFDYAAALAKAKASQSPELKALLKESSEKADAPAAGLPPGFDGAIPPGGKKKAPGKLQPAGSTE